jgi:hypothetical protein
MENGITLSDPLQKPSIREVIFIQALKGWSDRVSSRINKLKEKQTRDELKEELRAHLPEFKKVRDEAAESTKKAGRKTKEQYRKFRQAMSDLVDDCEEILQD